MVFSKGSGSMAYYSSQQFSTFQGRALIREASRSLIARSRLPIVTLGLGALAAIAIFAGALDRLSTTEATNGELGNYQFMTGNTVE